MCFSMCQSGCWLNHNFLLFAAGPATGHAILVINVTKCRPLATNESRESLLPGQSLSIGDQVVHQHDQFEHQAFFDVQVALVLSQVSLLVGSV